jgi:hypothetical protein
VNPIPLKKIETNNSCEDNEANEQEGVSLK